MFDISKLSTGTKAEAGVAMEIIHPASRERIFDENGNPITITLLGRTSDAYRDAMRRTTQRRVERNARGIKLGPDELERDEVEILVACVRGWTFDTFGGEPFPFTPANARRLFSDPGCLWMREQAMNFVLADGNFLSD